MLTHFKHIRHTYEAIRDACFAGAASAGNQNVAAGQHIDGVEGKIDARQ